MHSSSSAARYSTKARSKPCGLQPNSVASQRGQFALSSGGTGPTRCSRSQSWQRINNARLGSDAGVETSDISAKVDTAILDSDPEEIDKPGC